MADSRDEQALNDLLGSSQIFTSAVTDLLTEQLREVGGGTVTFSQVKLLKMVSLTAGYTVSHVAEFLGVSAAAASRSVDRLVRSGLLNRTEVPQDRRAVELSLTERGESLLARYDRATRTALRRVFGPHSEEELRRASALLDRLSVELVEEGGSPDGVCFRCGIHFRGRCLLRESRSRSCFFHRHQRPAGAKGAGGGQESRRRSSPKRS